MWEFPIWVSLSFAHQLNTIRSGICNTIWFPSELADRGGVANEHHDITLINLPFVAIDLARASIDSVCGM